jgi:hypothetical protein
MSYTTRYRIAYKRFSDASTTIDILDASYAGSITNLTAAGDPLNISFTGDINNIYAPTIGSGATLNVVSTPLTLIDLFTNDPQKYMVKIYNGGSGSNLFWQGFVNAGIYNESYSIGSTMPSIITIQCNDGMNVLDSLYYRQSDSSTLYTGLCYIGTVLNNILGKLGITFNNVLTSNDLTLVDYTTNFFTNLKVNNANYVNENSIPMTCREVLDSIMGGLGLSMQFKGSDIYILDPINLHNTIKGKTYDLTTFTENSSTFGGYLDISNKDINWYQSGSNLDIIPNVNEVDVKYDPYTFVSYSYDFNQNASLAGGWGHITVPSEWYNNSTVSFSGWVDSSTGHCVGAKEKEFSNPTYMFRLFNTDLAKESSLTLQLSNIGGLYKDVNLSLKISLDGYFQTRENNYNIFAPVGGSQVYCYYIQTSIKVGNQYYKGGATGWETGQTGAWHTPIPIISCTNAQYDADHTQSTVNDTWITGSVNVPLDNTLDGSIGVEFCIYDYWDTNMAVTTRHYDNPAYGILVKNLDITVINSKTGKPIENLGINKKGNLSTNLIYKSKPVEISTKNGTGTYGLSKGAFKDTTNNNIIGIFRGTDYVNIYNTEDTILQSFISQYKEPRLKLKGDLDAKDYMLNLNMKLIKDTTYQGNKAFYITSGTYNDKNEYMSIEMVECANTRENIVKIT